MNHGQHMAPRQHRLRACDVRSWRNGAMMLRGVGSALRDAEQGASRSRVPPETDTMVSEGAAAPIETSTKRDIPGGVSPRGPAGSKDSRETSEMES